MSSPEERERHSRRRKRNIYARILRDPNELRGAFSTKTVKAKKGQPYRREKINLDEIIKEGNFDE